MNRNSMVGRAVKLTGRHFLFRQTKWFVLACIVLIVLIVAAAFVFWDRYDWQLTATAIGGIFGLLFVVQKQRLDEVKLFHELFTSFNRRFAEINKQLTEIDEGDGNVGLTLPERETLNTYFDLCAEEYFFAGEEYIYPDVWKTWLRGMAYFYKNARIRRYWDSRGASPDLYYGFSTDILRRAVEEQAAAAP